LRELDKPSPLMQVEFMRYVTSCSWFFKEKWDGRAAMARIDQFGVLMFNIETDESWYMEKHSPGMQDYCVWAQYEIMSDNVAKLCSVNSVWLNDERLPMCFMERQQLVTNNWFARVWRPLNELPLVPPVCEGYILMQGDSVMCTYMKRYNGSRYFIGGARSVSFNPTVDVSGAYSTVELDSDLNVVRRRGNKQPNDSYRFHALSEAATYDCLLAFKHLNGLGGDLLIKDHYRTLDTWYNLDPDYRPSYLNESIKYGEWTVEKLSLARLYLEPDLVVIDDSEVPPM